MSSINVNKKILIFPPLSKGRVGWGFLLAFAILVFIGLIFFTDFFSTKTASAAWYSSGGVWTNRKAITIDHTKVADTDASGGETNFPVLIDITDSGLQANARSDGYDILFTSSDGSTKLAHEIEVYTSATGRLTAWVKVPSLSSSVDTTIYMYYGNASASNQQDATSVWDTNYKSVIHFKETSGTLSDSSGNSNTAAPSASGSSSTGSGKIGNAYSFTANDGSWAKITNNSSWAANTTKFSIEFWIKVLTPRAYASPITAGNWADDTFNMMNSDPVNTLSFSIAQTGPTWTRASLVSSNLGYLSSADGVFHHIVGTFNSVTGYSYMYSDGVQVGYTQYSQGTTNLGAKDLYIGGTGNYSSLNSVIDEVRISNGIDRSADWIKTEYNNQNSPSTFYSYGGQEQSNRAASTADIKLSSSAAVAGIPGWFNTGGNWTYRKKISIDNQKVATTTGPNITNFPVLVSVTDSDLKFTGSGGKVASSTAGDIIFTNADGTTALNYEIEKYTSTTGELVAWVQIPFLSSTSATPIYMYFGNASAPNVSASTAQNVWDTNYKGVLHLPNGISSLSAANSVSGGLSTSIVGSPTYATGKIDGGGSFTVSDYDVKITDSNTYTGGVTVSLWLKSTDRNYYRGIFYTESGIWLGFGGDLYLYSDDTYATFYNVGAVGNWEYYVFTFQPTASAVYKDGIYLRDAGGYSSFAPVAWHFGEKTYSNTLNGLEDEIRISSGVRSADWIKTEYNNQSSPSTFYSYGGLESPTRQNSAGATMPAVKVRGGVKFR